MQCNPDNFTLTYLLTLDNLNDHYSYNQRFCNVGAKSPNCVGSLTQFYVSPLTPLTSVYG